MKQYKMGGHQERNKRAGTENVAGIVGDRKDLIDNSLDNIKKGGCFKI